MYKIYMLYSYNTNKYYVGTTRNSLAQSLALHIHKAERGAKSRLYDCMRENDPTSFHITEVVSFNRKEDCLRGKKLHLKSCKNFSGDRLLNLV